MPSDIIWTSINNNRSYTKPDIDKPGLIFFHPTYNYGYVYNTSDYSCSVCIPDTITGEFRYISNTANFSTSTSATPKIAWDKKNNLLFVCSGTTATIRLFSFSPNNGSLTFLSDTVLASTVNQFVVSPLGFLYAACADAYVRQISVSGSSLSVVASTLAPSVLNTPSGLSYHPFLNILYLATNINNIWAYQIDPSTGNLGTYTSISIPNSSGTTQRLDCHPNGKFLYSYAYNSNLLNAYSINQTDGSMTWIHTITQTSFGGSSAPLFQSIHFHSNNNFLYMNSSRHPVFGYSIDQLTGLLTCIDIFYSTTTLQDFAISSSSKFGYISKSTTNTIYICSINEITGILAKDQLATSTLMSSVLNVIIHPSKYVAYCFSSNSSTSYIHTISQSDGTFTLASTFSVQYAISGTISPSGKFLYVAQQNTNGTISVWNIDQTTGLLSFNSSIDTSESSIARIAINSNETVLYAYTRTSRKIFVFYIDPATGGLTSSGSSITVGTYGSITGIILRNNFLFVSVQRPTTSPTINLIAIYSINSADGLLTLASTYSESVSTLYFSSLEVDSSGSFIYCGTNNNIYKFIFNSSTNIITFSGVINIHSLLPEATTLYFDITSRILYVGTPQGMYIYSSNKINGELNLISYNSTLPAVWISSGYSGSASRGTVVDTQKLLVYVLSVNYTNNPIFVYKINTNNYLFSGLLSKNFSLSTFLPNFIKKQFNFYLKPILLFWK